MEGNTLALAKAIDQISGAIWQRLPDYGKGGKGVPRSFLREGVAMAMALPCKYNSLCLTNVVTTVMTRPMSMQLQIIVLRDMGAG